MAYSIDTPSVRPHRIASSGSVYSPSPNQSSFSKSRESLISPLRNKIRTNSMSKSKPTTGVTVIYDNVLDENDEVELIDDEWLNNFGKKLGGLKGEFDEYEQGQSELQDQLHSMIQSDDLQPIARTQSVDSVFSINSELDIELNYKLTNLIKQNQDNQEVLTKISKLRNIVNQSLEFINENKDNTMNNKFANQLTDLVESFIR